MTYTTNDCEGGAFPATGRTLGPVNVTATTSGGGVQSDTATALRQVRCGRGN